MYPNIFDNIKLSSDDFRRGGNKQFEAGNYCGALISYNEALVRAGSDKVRAALCYGNRSAAYLQLKCFRLCLNNIDLAEPHFPADKISRLHERRERCLKMMMDSLDRETTKPFGEPMQLSYPANPKLPFFIDAIEMRRDKVFGRQLVTTKDLKAGDVVMLCDENVLLANASFNAFECGNCMRSNNFNLYKSLECDHSEFKRVMHCDVSRNRLSKYLSRPLLQQRM